MNKLGLVALATVSLLLVSAPASAAVFNLEDENAMASFDTGGSGQVSWVVDGTSHLFRQTFFYRTGGDTSETEITQLDIVVEGTNDVDFDGDQDTLFVRYADPGGDFEVQVTYKLSGGQTGSMSSGLAEEIVITNLTNQALDFTLFQYVDFDLGGDSDDDMGQFLSDTQVRQVDTGGNVLEVGEAVVTGSNNLTAHQIGEVDDIISSLEDGGITNLNNNNGPIFGNVEWAFQWDMTLNTAGNPASSVTISKNKVLNPVPEPSSVIIWSLLGLAIGGYARFRKRSA
jgi:hypothetical protein